MPKRISKSFYLVLVLILAVIGTSAVNALSSRRIYGDDRYDTSYEVVRYEASLYGKFKNVIVVTGDNYPDAISAGVLSKSKDAPIILVNKSHEAKTLKVVKDVLMNKGTCYIVGGTSVVSTKFESDVKKAGFNIKRLGGQTLYDTNLLVLKEANVVGPLMVVTGNSYYDALSTVASGYRTMFVKNSVTQAQKNYLKDKKVNSIFIIGGIRAVSTSVEKQLRSAVPNARFQRIGGIDAYETSWMYAQRMFDNHKKDSAVIVTGKGFTDGIAASHLAYKLDAPVLLADSDKWQDAHNYVYSNKIKNVYIVGGPNAIPNKTAENIGNTNLKVVKVNRKETDSKPMPVYARKSAKESSAPSYGDSGWLTVPKVNIGVPLYNVMGLSSAQGVVDRPNSAAYYSYWGNKAVFDHSSEGLFGLVSVTYGDKAYITDKNGLKKEYVCTGVWTAKNMRTELISPGGVKLFPESYYDLMLATCLTSDGKYDTVRGFTLVN